MLELKNITKTYKVGEIETKALRGVSMAFREREFVAILGASGSGKTTCLNIIGGLDRYDGGEMTIKGKKTATFKDRDWDAYRNNSVGFVFQSYNLIGHLSIVANVELGMTLSGVSKAEKRQRAVEVLTQVGLKDHLHKKPNQLSGGQMQRVAIARALANDPEILLCDEPTGALDTKTSHQIMDLIRALSKERLVIMVTHNPEIAEEYADRTIRFEDGRVESDTNPHIERDKPDMFSLKKTAMSFVTALNLSGNNILTKKGRTFLTAFASSIGIIGIAVILSLSNGFQMQIDKFQEDALAEFPVIVPIELSEFNAEEIAANQAARQNERNNNEENLPPTEVRVFDRSDFYTTHQNIFTDEYLDYINNIDPSVCATVGYQRMVSMNVLRKNGDNAAPVNFPSLVNMMSSGNPLGGGGGMNFAGMGLSSFPKTLGDGATYLERNFELLEGRLPEHPTEMIMIVGRNGRLDKNLLEGLGFDVGDEDNVRDSIPFSEILEAEFRLIDNDDYYRQIGDMSELAGMGGGGSVGNGGGNFLDLIDLSSIPDGTPVQAALEQLLAQLAQAQIPGFSSASINTEEIPAEILAGVVMQNPAGTLVVGEGSRPLVLLVTDPATGVIAFTDPVSGTVMGTFPDMSSMPGMPSGGGNLFIPSQEYNEMWDSNKSVTLKIVGIVRNTDDSGISLLSNGIVYSDELCELVVRNAQDSAIVKAQLEQEESVFPTSPESASIPKEMMLRILGGESIPVAIMLYPSSFEMKDALIDYLSEWNEGKADEDQVHFMDLAQGLLEFMSDITAAITVVLIAFASISLVVSLIMISIITYISVLERTKEIGILRALGARKKDITRVFDAETFIIGLCSGILGVTIAWLITFPANVIIENMTNLPDVAQLNILHVVGLVTLSTALTVLGGHLPARMAAKRDAVEALRSD